MAATAARLFDAIVVEGQDRRWRDQAEMHAAIKQLRFLGIEVFSVGTGSDLTDYGGRVVATVLGLKDEIFLEDLRAKTHRGMAGAVRRGQAAGGRAFGYRSERMVDERGYVAGARRVVDTREADVVRYIFQLYALDGLTPRAIAHRLNAEGVAPPRTARGRASGSWTPATITGSATRTLGILNNPLYVGQVLWNRSRKVRDPQTGRRLMRVRPPDERVRTEAPNLRIVPDDLWQRAQSRRAERRYRSLAVRAGHARGICLRACACARSVAAHMWCSTIAPVSGTSAARHYDRGPTGCPNGKLVRRDVLEGKVLAHVFGDLFAPPRLFGPDDRCRVAGDEQHRRGSACGPGAGTH